MFRYLLALVAVLACCVPVEATGRVRVRGTPFRPRVGPVVIAPRGYSHDSRNFARDFHGDVRGFRGDVLIERDFVDRYGRVRTGLFDSRGNLVRIIH